MLRPSLFIPGVCTLAWGCLSSAVSEEMAPPIEPSALHRLIDGEPDLLSAESAAAVADAINASPLARGYVHMRIHGPPVKPHRAVQFSKDNAEQVGAHHYCMRTVPKAEVLDCISQTTQAARAVIEAAYIHPSLCFQSFDGADEAQLEALFESRTIEAALEDCSQMSSQVGAALVRSGHQSPVPIKGIDGMAEAWDYESAVVIPQEALDRWKALEKPLTRITSRIKSLIIMSQREASQQQEVTFDRAKVEACMAPIAEARYDSAPWQPGNDHAPAREHIETIHSQLKSCPTFLYEVSTPEQAGQEACEEAANEDIRKDRRQDPGDHAGITALDVQNICARVLKEFDIRDPVEVIDAAFVEQTGVSPEEARAQRQRVRMELRRAFIHLEEAQAQESDCMGSCRQHEIDACCIRVTGNDSCESEYTEVYTTGAGTAGYQQVTRINGDALSRCGTAADRSCRFCDDDWCGVRVAAVTPDGPAAAAELPADAIISQIAETPSRKLTEALNAIDTHRPGDSIVLQTNQGDFTVTLDSSRHDLSTPRIGAELEQQWCPR